MVVFETQFVLNLPPHHPSRVPRAIGNGESIAFVTKEGTISWWDFHNTQEPAVFMDLVAPGTGGHFGFYIGDAASERVLKPKSQQYVGNTNILETVLGDETMAVTVHDFLPFGRNLLVRNLTIENSGTEERTLQVKPEIVYNPEIEMSLEERVGGIISRNHQSTFSANFTPNAEPTYYAVKPGETVFLNFALGYGDDSSLNAVFELDNESFEIIQEQTANYWLDISRKLRLPKSMQASAMRLSLGMMLLLDDETGAALASPTTSLPSVPFGAENDAWDYRATWLRDSRYVLEALLELGLANSARQILDFFFSVQNEDGSWNPMYSRKGGEPLDERLSGHHVTYDGVCPVKHGNGAKGQLQLDSAGHVLVSTRNYVQSTGDVAYAEAQWDGISAAADYMLTQLNTKDNGPWEARDNNGKEHWVYSGPRNFTYSKVMMFAGLNAAVEMAHKLGFADTQGWEAGAAYLKEQVLARAWSDEKQAFVQYFTDEPGPEVIDILAIAMVRHGMIGYDDPRWKSTEARLWEELEQEGGMKRHDADVNDFYPATFKFAQHLADHGDVTGAEYLINSSLEASQNCILAEQHRNGTDAAQLGNHLLGWSHAAALNAIFAYDRALHEAELIH